MRLKISNRNMGFSLVETLVAIGILSLSVAATFTAVQSGIQNSTNAKDQITAFFLAQEAMEYIKNIRDENALHSVNGEVISWLAGLSSVVSDPCYFGRVCQIDSPLKVVAYCGDSAVSSNPPLICPNLNQDTVTSRFGYTVGWPTSRFKREIQFQQVVADTEVSVIISISWTSRTGTKSFQATERLFNRQ